MRLLTLAWRNVWRNRNRSLLQLSAIGTAVFLGIFAINVARGANGDLIGNAAKAGSGHVALYHAGYPQAREVADTLPADALLPEVAKLPGLVAVHARLMVPGLLRSSRDSRPVVAMGLDLASEAGTNPMLDPKNLVSGHVPGPGEPEGVLVGADLARELTVKAHKKVVFTVQDANGQVQSHLYRIAGVVHTGLHGLDSGLIVLARPALGELVGRPGAAHEIALQLTGPDRIPATMQALKPILARYPGAIALTWDQAMPGVASAIQLRNRAQLGLFTLLDLLVAIGTVNTLLMSVMDRVRELGVLRALGLTRRQLTRLIVLEGVLLGAVGVGAGFLLAVLAGLYTSTVGLDISRLAKGMEVGGAGMSPIMHSIWHLPTMAYTTVGMFLLTALASWYPARWATRIRPADAMRSSR